MCQGSENNMFYERFNQCRTLTASLSEELPIFMLSAVSTTESALSLLPLVANTVNFLFETLKPQQMF